MSLDITNVFKQMAQSAGQSLQAEGAEFGTEISVVLENNQASIAELVEARTCGDINEEDFQLELAREKVILEAELIAQEIAGKAAVQKAVNSAMLVLTSAVSAAL
ncbi:hypothetical protein SG34_024080 [Thalassomonas viridans]|uniref:Uncharacterized protein n=1 Tax=Thalassomonas viridans TaxID=137584 RepID=A0AAE9Z071_9GAMM|nr:hypothetical protein [Thalassomonas viridans]WDE04386.1 hypothetical protein SG34_024080 [Thalassomonas viridans]